MTSFGADKTTWASIPKIAARMSVSENTARKAQKALEDSGWMIKGDEIPGATTHWKMLAPFERTPAQREGAHRVKGGGSSGEGVGFTGRGGVVHGMNPKQEDKHELNHELKQEGGASAPQVPLPVKNKKPEGKDKGNRLLKLQESPIGIFFRDSYFKVTGFNYSFGSEDVNAADRLATMGMSDIHQVSAAAAFFDGGSWHRQNKSLQFKTFVGAAQGYLLKGRPSDKSDREAKLRYYEPWDPRHPNFKAGDLVQAQQKRYHEEAHGRWVPKTNIESKGV
jgi:hypothetical protein